MTEQDNQAAPVAATTTPVEATKSDRVLATEIREILDAYVAKANEMRTRGLVVNFGILNGADGKPVALNGFTVIKQVEEWKPTPPTA